MHVYAVSGGEAGTSEITQDGLFVSPDLAIKSIKLSYSNTNYRLVDETSGAEFPRYLSVLREGLPDQRFVIQCQEVLDHVEHL